MGQLFRFARQRVKDLVRPESASAEQHDTVPVEVGIADPQHESFFFRLPPEVRETIYGMLWESAGTSLHIFQHNGKYRHSRCYTDHHGPDERQTELEDIFQQGYFDGYPRDRLWTKRLVSPWGNHWLCEEKAAAHLDRQNSKPDHVPFLPLLLCCRRTYFECCASIGARITFNFTSLQSAANFLTVKRPAIVHEIRVLQFSILLELTDEDTRIWTELRHRLWDLGGLRRVCIWLDTADSRARGKLLQRPQLYGMPDKLPNSLHVILSIPGEPESTSQGSAGNIIIRNRGRTLFWVHPDEARAARTQESLARVRRVGWEPPPPMQAAHFCTAPRRRFSRLPFRN